MPEATQELTLLDSQVTTADLERAKLFAEIRLAELAADEVEARLSTERLANYNNRVLHFADIVEGGSMKHMTHAVAQLARDSLDPIRIILHTPGGDIFSGLGFHDFLVNEIRPQGIEVTTEVMGGAFSMGGVILQAGDRRVMTPNSWLMIHEAGSGLFSKTSEMRDQVELMESLEAQLYGILAERSTLDAEDIKERSKRKDWFLSAEDALHFGLIDEIHYAPLPEPIRRRKGRK